MNSQGSLLLLEEEEEQGLHGVFEPAAGGMQVAGGAVILDEARGCSCNQAAGS
jgi:hypothetical protein